MMEYWLDKEDCPLTFEQCTGLKDKNGKLIYEGDIVETHDYTTEHSQIVFDKGCYVLKRKDVAVYEHLSNYEKECEISGIHWYFTSTASGIRTAVNFKSNVNNGMEREITVYNADGKVIMHMKGKFDIQHSNRSLQYIDQNHMKHNIYFGDNTTVTVNEVKK